jgi:hypothetical protein
MEILKMLLLLACTNTDSNPKESENSELIAELQSWSDGPLLETARDHHVSFVEGDYLFVLGGSTGMAATSGSERALVQEGGLGVFEKADRMPEALLGMGICGGTGRYVIAGGLDGTSNSSPSSYVIEVIDGILSFKEAPDLGESRYHLGLACIGSYVFAIGGLIQIYDGTVSQSISTAVERATLDESGTLSRWERVGELPEPRTHHATVVDGSSIYLIGGGEGVAAYSDILRATVAEDGSVSSWEPAGNMPEGRATSSAFVRDGFLYMLAGMTKLTGGEVDTVLRAEVLEDGSIGTFEELEPLPLARAHSHQAPIFGDTLYSIGGSIEHEPQNQFFINRFQIPPF